MFESPFDTRGQQVRTPGLNHKAFVALFDQVGGNLISVARSAMNNDNTTSSHCSGRKHLGQSLEISLELPGRAAPGEFPGSQLAARCKLAI